MTPSYSCEKCGHGFVTKQQLMSHLESHESKDFACDQCGKSFVSKKRLKTHLNQRHATSNSCSYCGSKFAHVTSLNTHIKEIHNQMSSSFCQYCHKQYHIRYIKRHERACKMKPKRFDIFKIDSVDEIVDDVADDTVDENEMMNFINVPLNENGNNNFNSLNI